MGLFAWIKRLLERDDEDELLEDCDAPEVMTWIRSDKLAEHPGDDK